MRALAVVLSLSLLLGCASQPAPRAVERPDAAIVLRDGGAKRVFWPCAHRGERKKGVRENSIAAIEAAVRAGVPLIEVDLRTGNDGTLLLHHDPTIGRDYDGPSEWRGRTPESLDVREAERAGIATYEAALSVVRGSRSCLVLDLKAESPEQVDLALTVAHALGAIDRIVVQCQDPRTLVYVRAKHTGVLALARCRSVADVDRALDHAPELVQLEEPILTRGLARRIHEGRARVLVKTLGFFEDRSGRWNDLFDHGADVILTDHASDLLRAVESRLDVQSK